jgi:hypothetical protein
MLIVAFAAVAFCDGNDRKGFYCTIGINAGFVPAIVYTSLGESMDTIWRNQGSFPKYHGGATLDMHIGRSSGNTASSFVSSLTWFYPSSIFDYSVFAGYAFTRYARSQPPSMVLELLIGPEFRIISGLNEVSPVFFGLKTGIKAGYEFTRRFTGWAGVCAGYGYREYTIWLHAIAPNDFSNTMQYGSIKVTENMINGTLSVGGSYSF